MLVSTQAALIDPLIPISFLTIRHELDRKMDPSYFPNLNIFNVNSLSTVEDEEVR